MGQQLSTLVKQYKIISNLDTSDIVGTLIIPAFSLEKGILISYQSRSVVRKFLVNESPSES